jgi:flavin-dependent dehydrogenase
VETARIVVGADGVLSPVAAAVGAEEYVSTAAGTAVWYSYWEGTGLDELVVTRVPGTEMAVVPTNDGRVNVMVGVKEERFREFRGDVEGNYHRGLDLFPEFAERVRGGRRVEPFHGTRQTRQFLRKPYGNGWALVGDAAYHKDPISGSGVSDAFRQVDVLVDAIDAGLSGRRQLSWALAGYHAWRDHTFIPVLEYIARIATLDEFPPEILGVIKALQHAPDQRDRFLGLVGGQTSFTDFFSPENCGRIMATAAAAAAQPELAHSSASSA